MYKTHVGYSSPENQDAGTWRYMDFSRFMAMIHNSTLWFARLDKMQDQYEGAMPQGQADVLRGALDTLAVGKPGFKAKVDAARDCLEREYATRTRQSIFVNCWHLSDYESGAMWRIYSENGIAIRSTFARLRDCFIAEPDFDIWIGVMRYVDFENSSEFQYSHIGPGLYKRPMYDFEKEIRAVIHHDRAESRPAGLDVRVNLDTLIESIYVGPGRPEWFVRLVKSMLEKFDLGHKPVKRSGMDGKPMYLA